MRASPQEGPGGFVLLTTEGFGTEGNVVPNQKHAASTGQACLQAAFAMRVMKASVAAQQVMKNTAKDSDSAAG